MPLASGRAFSTRSLCAVPKQTALLRESPSGMDFAHEDAG